MNQFRCSYGACIPITWACDGINDCGDESDENTHCVFKSKLIKLFLCIISELICNTILYEIPIMKILSFQIV